MIMPLRPPFTKPSRIRLRIDDDLRIRGNSITGRTIRDTLTNPGRLRNRSFFKALRPPFTKPLRIRKRTADVLRMPGSVPGSLVVWAALFGLRSLDIRSNAQSSCMRLAISCWQQSGQSSIVVDGGEVILLINSGLWDPGDSWTICKPHGLLNLSLSLYLNLSAFARNGYG
jgi:hypothetical protein